MLVDRIDLFQEGGKRLFLKIENERLEEKKRRERKDKKREKEKGKKEREENGKEEGWGCFLGGVVFIQTPFSFTASCPEEMES